MYVYQTVIVVGVIIMIMIMITVITMFRWKFGKFEGVYYKS